jgi:hypothetical protein
MTQRHSHPPSQRQTSKVKIDTAWVAPPQSIVGLDSPSGRPKFGLLQLHIPILFSLLPVAAAANRRPPSAGIAEETSRQPSRRMLAADFHNVNRDSESSGTVYVRMSFGTARAQAGCCGE